MHLPQKWNAPTATSAGTAAVGDLTGNSRTLSADEINYLPLAYVKAVTDLGVEIHRNALSSDQRVYRINYKR
jgi:hypothetical protein